MDTEALEATADQVYTQNTVLAPGYYTGVIFSRANLQLNGPVEIHGTLVVKGSLDIDGGGGLVLFEPGAESAALLVAGNLEIEDTDQLSLAGIVVVEGNVIVSEVTTLTSTASLSINGNLDLNGVVSECNLDPDVVGTGLTEVADLSTIVKIVEVWRRPN